MRPNRLIQKYEREAGAGVVTKNPKTRDEREHREAVALMQMVTLHERRCPKLKYLAHIPNGGARSKAASGKLKAEGVKKGVPDYLWPVRSRQFIGLAIELKAQSGEVSAEQEDWIEHLQAEGWFCIVAYGWEKAWEAIEVYMHGVLP